jgi:hypothetical protein
MISFQAMQSLVTRGLNHIPQPHIVLRGRGKFPVNELIAASGLLSGVWPTPLIILLATFHPNS